MAKSYLGGHTVVGADSGWFTGVNHKPVGDDAKPWVPKKPKAPTKKQEWQQPSRVDTKAADAANDSMLRVAYIYGILDAHFLNRNVPPPPKKLREVLSKEVERAGGPLRWARAQREFEKIILKKRKKFKVAPSAGQLTPLPAVVGTGNAISASTRLSILKADQQRLETRKEAAANIIRECDRQLIAIKNELRELDKA